MTDSAIADTVQGRGTDSSLIGGGEQVFAGPDWEAVLRAGFGATRQVFPLSGGTDAAVLDVFRAGPFRIGYLGFPAGGTALGRALSDAGMAHLRACGIERSVHFLRLRCSSFLEPPADGANTYVAATTATEPESCLLDLHNFDSDRVAKVRRDLRRSERAGVVVSSPDATDWARAANELYAATVRRHRGRLRYTAAYFEALAAAAERNPRIVPLVSTRDGAIDAYVVAILDGRLAYYLHGGASPAAQKAGATDALVARAIEVAQAAGCDRFNMMTSPPEQPTLTRFKEKWGSETRPMTTCDVVFSPAAYRLFRLAGRAEQWLSRVLGR